MLDNIYWLLTYVRYNILQAFIIPGLEISYWDFLIYLTLAGVTISVLINAVNISADRPRIEKIKRERESRYKSRKEG